jgi:retron-type reverse transcriptase
MIDAPLLLQNLFQAYLDARKHKRNTHNQLAFEYHLEDNLMQLHQELLAGTYQIGRSIYFIQQHPVKREVFAGSFRDRIVHHLIYNYISPLFEKTFIYDSYSCRKGKGTSRGVQRVSKFLRSCSQNYTQDCYILKLDIQGYFMAIHKDLLYHKLVTVLSTKSVALKSQGIETDFLLALIHQVIYNDPTKNGIFKGRKSDYNGLPQTKSLFFAPPDCGLPIGNLTSQLFSNVYLNDFDKYVKQDLSIKYYGRYVDDFVLVHSDLKYLKSLIPQFASYLSDCLHLQLHPKKIYLQHYSKGVLFVGSMIKPYRCYLRKRTLGYWYQKIQMLNQELLHAEATDNIPLFHQVLTQFHTVMNSYL